MSEEEEIDKIRDVASQIYDAIFEGLDAVEIEGEIYAITQTSRSKVKLVERDGYTYIQQNPHKDSRWAKLAREGHQIMWVMQGRKYLAQIKDGKFLNLKRK
ncbi:MAG: hypothetical protein AM325_013990 [Candidatus Thorarchaeota archaeon SMTZ1-45]|nr:MAG: hypothetical protein AM325_15505 [Candidatus Thorarchaeota archaeon SMTZ1-45]